MVSARSGARLTALGWRAGAAVKFARFHDTATDRDCSFVTHGDGSLRCLPGSLGLTASFLDPECTEPVVADDAAVPLDEDFTIEDDFSAPTFLTGRLGDPVAVAGTSLYVRSEGNCELDAEDEDFVGRRFVPADPTSFVGGTIGTVETGQRIAPRVIVGDDGSRAPLAGEFSDAAGIFMAETYVDTDLGVPVAPIHLTWTEPFAGAVAWTERLGSVSRNFTDASCTQPLITKPDEDTAVIAALPREDSATCTLTAELFAVTPAAARYQRSGDACTLAGELDDPTQNQLGAPLDPARYVQGAIAPASADRLTTLEISAGAARFDASLFDRETGFPCVPVALPGDATRAVCVTRTRFATPMFADNTCTKRVLTALPTDIQARACYAGPPVRVVTDAPDLPRTQVRMLEAGERLADRATVFVQIGPACVDLIDPVTTFAVASERIIDLAELALEELP